MLRQANANIGTLLYFIVQQLFQILLQQLYENNLFKKTMVKHFFIASRLGNFSSIPKINNTKFFQIANVLLQYYYLMQERNRNTNTCDQNISSQNCEYVFLLRRIISCQRVVEIRADFSPPSPQSSSLGLDSPSFSFLPKFNKDSKYYTPSFILPQDEAKLKEKDLEFHDNHVRKVEEIIDEKDELLVPKPSKANRYCLICKQTYDDYLTHISYPSHNRLLKQSAFYNDILELCSQKQPKNMKRTKKITKQRKKKEQTQKLLVPKLRKQKSNQTLSTGVQSNQQIQLSATIK